MTLQNKNWQQIWAKTAGERNREDELQVRQQIGRRSGREEADALETVDPEAE